MNTKSYKLATLISPCDQWQIEQMQIASKCDAKGRVLQQSKQPMALGKNL